MNKINNFIDRQTVEKELELIEQILTLSNYRGIIIGDTYKGLEEYQDTLYAMLEQFDKANFPQTKKKQ